MKTILKLLSVAAVLFTTTIFANGVYIFGQFGRVHQDDLPNISGTAKSTIDKYGYRLGVGYNRPQSETFTLGAKFGFGYYGKTIWNNTDNNAAYSHTIYGYDLQAVATYHTGPKLDFMAHGGLALLQDKVVTNFSDQNKNHLKPIVGFGAAYNIDQNLGVTLNYDHIFGNNVSAGSFDRLPSINTWWLGFRYKFNSYANEAEQQ